MKLAIAALSLGLGAHAGAADALRDPTRPPPGFTGQGAAIAPAAASGTESDAPPLALQSILRGSPGATRAPAAIIAGRLVPLGGRVGALTLARIDDGSVRLTGPGGPLTLTLLPPLVPSSLREVSR